MGLFGKIFEKKSCDICGGEIGLLGNRKLEDGNLCKECAKKLSPFFSERRRSTVEQIREQLDYREANKDRVAGFNTTRTLGGDTKVLLDEDAQCFIVTSSSRWRDANPDVMDFSQVTGCDSEVRETRTEIYRENSEGHRESYDPPRRLQRQRCPARSAGPPQGRPRTGAASSAAARSGFNTAGTIVGAASSGVHDRVVGMGKLFGKEVPP